jgi:hypothetical protein
MRATVGGAILKPSLVLSICFLLLDPPAIDPIGIFDWTGILWLVTLNHGNRSHYGARKFACSVATSH